MIEISDESGMETRCSAHLGALQTMMDHFGIVIIQ